MEALKKKIHELISRNKIEEALNELIVWSHDQKETDLENNFITLKSRFTQVKQKERLGILGYSDALREQAFISSSILDMLQQVYEEKKEKPSPDPLDSLSKKTILFLASSPTDWAKLAMEKEFVRISSSLQDGKTIFKLVAEWAISPGDLQKAIIKHRPNIIHFSGHGRSEKNGVGGIILQDAQAQAQPVSGKALENLFKIFSGRLNIDVVLLNACYSEEQATGIGVHVPYVIGMKDKVKDTTGIEFSTGFYRGLAEEEDVEFAFDLAVNLIQLEGLSDEDVPVLLKRKG